MTKLYRQLKNDLNRRARRAHAAGHLTLADLERVFDHYGGKCLVPGCDNPKITFDHVKPLERGGSNDVANLQLLCESHNKQKGDRDETDYRNGDILQPSDDASNTYHAAGYHCQATTKNGTQCAGYAVNGSAYCFTHDPSRAAERAAAHKRGGQNRPRPTNDTPFPSADVKTSAGILQLMESVFKETWTLETSIARSRTLGYLAQVQRGVLETGLEERVKRLEELAANGELGKKNRIA